MMKKIVFSLVLLSFLAIGFAQPAPASAAPAAAPSAAFDCGLSPKVPTFSGKDIFASASVSCSATVNSIAISMAIYGEDGYWYGGQSKTTWYTVKSKTMNSVVNHNYVTIPAQKYRTQACGWVNGVSLGCAYSGWSAKYVP